MIMNTPAGWESFEGVVLKSSVQATILAVLVLAVQGLFGRKLSPRWRYALWWLVAARLLLPVSPAGPVSIFNWLRWPAPSLGVATPVSAPRVASQPVEAPAALTSPAQLTPAWPQDAVPTEPAPQLNPANTDAGPVAAPAMPWTAPARARSVVTWRHGVLWLWGLGVVALVVHLSRSVSRLRRELRGATPVSEPGLLALLDRCREQMRVRGRLILMETPAVNSPALCGFWRPRLLLPPGLLASFTPQELRFIFLHELAHVRRGDIAVNWLTTLLQIVHWFNPVVWLAFSRLLADRELACDALALTVAEAGEQRAYGETILKLLEGFARPSAMPGLVGILEEKHQMKRRIRMIAQFRRGGRWAWLSGIAAAVLGIVCLTDAQTGKQGQRPNATGAQTNQAQTARVQVSLVTDGRSFSNYDTNVVRAIWRQWSRLQEKAHLGVERPRKESFTVVLESSGRMAEVQSRESNLGDEWTALCRQAILDASPLEPWPEKMRRMVGEDPRKVMLIFHIDRGEDQKRTDSPVAKPAREVRRGADPEPQGDGTNLQTQTMKVTVVDTVTEEPLSNAEISAPPDDWRKTAPRRVTDVSGHYLLRIPLPVTGSGRRWEHFSFTVTHSNHAPRCLTWMSPGDIQSNLPKGVTVKLEPGIAIGGMVRDQRAAPVPGVRVLLSGGDYSSATMRTGQQEPHQNAVIYMTNPDEPAAVTDAEGRWTFAHFPSEADNVVITLIRPDESRQSLSTSESLQPMDPRPLIPLRALKDQTVVFTLRDGVAVRGIVVDEAGKPLSGVLVKEGYGYHGYLQRISEFTTDGNGRFERRNRVPRQWIYTASANGRATVSVVAQVDSRMPDMRIVMPPAKSLLLRVVDENGKPIPDARVTPTLRNEGQILDWSADLDAAGRAVWSNAPAEPVFFYVQRSGAGRTFKALAGDLENVCVLSRSTDGRAAVQVQALDAKTRKPANIRSVAVFYNGEGSYKRLAEPTGTQTTVEIRAADFRAGMATIYRVKVEADGYEPFITDFLELYAGDQTVEATMVSGTAVEGIALLADGKPAEGAQAWVRPQDRAGSVFANAPGHYDGMRWLKEQVGPGGRFKLPVLASNPPVIFTHDQGFLETTVEEVRGKSEVRLHPWGRIEGRLLVAGQRKEGMEVFLSSPGVNVFLAPFHLHYYTTSDADGAFVFNKVPPGDYLLYRHYIHGARMPSHQMPITVKPGETLKVDYGVTGRAITGRATVHGADISVNWQMETDTEVLALKQTPLPVVNHEDFATEQAYLAAYSALIGPAGQLRRAREARNYELVFNRDGRFHADDVPPGTYELRIKLNKPDVRVEGQNAWTPGGELGSLVEEAIVPQGEGPFDLGNIVVPVKAEAATPTQR